MLIKTDNVLTLGEIPRKTNSKDCSELRLLKVAEYHEWNLFKLFQNVSVQFSNKKKLLTVFIN